MTLRRSWRYQGGDVAPSHRLEALADGVFAIVMTLLVLELGVPILADANSGEVTDALREMWPEFLIYALSFVVLGMFWLIHKMMFDSIVGSDPPLVWINVLFLMVTALLPFTTALVGQYRALTVVAFAYGLNLFLAFAVAWVIWAYATHGNRLTEDGLDPVIVRGGNRMAPIYMVVFGGATALSLASPLAAYVAYAVVVALFVGLTMVGRWESVMVWAKTTDTEAE